MFKFIDSSQYSDAPVKLKSILRFVSIAIYTRCTQALPTTGYFRQEPGYRTMEDIIKYRDSELRSVGRAFDQRYTPPQRRRDVTPLTNCGTPCWRKILARSNESALKAASEFVNILL